MNIKEKISGATKWFFRKLIKWKFLKDKYEDLLVLEIMESYITEAILRGQEHRREELAQMQKKIEVIKDFIEFVKKL